MSFLDGLRKVIAFVEDVRGQGNPYDDEDTVTKEINDVNSSLLGAFSESSSLGGSQLENSSQPYSVYDD